MTTKLPNNSKVNRDASEEGLEQYFLDDWGVPKTIHPFMSEIARLACHRSISQGKLAKCYNEATGARIDSRNVLRHMQTRRLSRKVVQAYAQILSIGSPYLDLLLALESGHPVIRPQPHHTSFRDFLESSLDLEAVEVSLEGAATDTALGLLMKDEAFAIECLNKAELQFERSLAFDLKMSERERTLASLVRSGNTYRRDFDEINLARAIRLSTVALMLQAKYGFDWLSYGHVKSETNVNHEAILLDVFHRLISVIDEDEWLAIQYQLECIFRKKSLPVEQMRERLYGNSPAGDARYWRLRASALTL